MPELLIALYQLDPDGNELADRWLANPDIRLGNWIAELLVMRRVVVEGAMGRATFEGDWLTRRCLAMVDRSLERLHPMDGDGSTYLEEWIETFGSFGPAARLAIPRLNEFRKHPNPWVPMWASEALERIVPKPNSMPVAPSKTEPLPTALPLRN